VVNTGVHGNFVRSGGWGGVQQIRLRTDCRENRDLGAVAPRSVFPLNMQMSKTIFINSLLRMYFPRNWKFGSALSKLRNLGKGEDETRQIKLIVKPLVVNILTNNLSIRNYYTKTTILYFVRFSDKLAARNLRSKYN
jgi:hypothetical protein